MSTDDVHSEPPAARGEKEEEANVSGQRRASPALRLSAWLFAVVLLLVILGWALGGILQK